MKLVCYSLFSGPRAEWFETAAYVRGFYFNARMNNFIYPDWRTHLDVDRQTYERFKKLFDWLVENNTLHLVINETTPKLCEGMLWRLKPVFTIDVSHVLCRDADSVTTYREAQCVQQWLESGIPHHAINDNPAHGGLMGGMVGFTTARLKAAMDWNNWEDVIRGHDLSDHGSDQHMLNNEMSPLIWGNLVLHKIAGAGTNAAIIHTTVPDIQLPQVSPALWESNLVCRHMGSPGIVEMEMLRFLKRFDEYNWKFQPIEKEYPEIFHWHK